MIKEQKIAKVTDKSKLDKGFLTIVFTTFSTVFLAELGDKTQIATLLLSAQSGKPLIVFFGSALALISSSLICVLIGRWLARLIPPQRFEYMAGVLMIGIGLLLGFQATNSLIQNLNGM